MKVFDFGYRLAGEMMLKIFNKKADSVMKSLFEDGKTRLAAKIANGSQFIVKVYNCGFCEALEIPSNKEVFDPESWGKDFKTTVVENRSVVGLIVYGHVYDVDASDKDAKILFRAVMVARDDKNVIALVEHYAMNFMNGVFVDIGEKVEYAKDKDKVNRLINIFRSKDGKDIKV